jgi:hypothetical protein
VRGDGLRDAAARLSTDPAPHLSARAPARARPRAVGESSRRQLAEAIPKADDPSQLITRQVIVGNASEYLLIRPLRELAELDAQLPPDQLLTRAFGAGEGGLIFRNGGDALLSIERSIVGLVEPLSNPMP